MNQQHYLPIELSKLVHEKVPTLETDMSWKTTTFIDGIKSKPFLAKGIQGHNFVTRTYRLDDLMRALVELGKVKGWDIEEKGVDYQF